MEDKIVLFYVKDGTLYPVQLTKEQSAMVEIALGAIFNERNELRVRIDLPQGKMEVVT